MTVKPAKPVKKVSSPESHDDLPVLTEVVGNTPIIPTLTRVAAPPAATPGEMPAIHPEFDILEPDMLEPGHVEPGMLSAEDMQHLLEALAPRLEAALKIRLAAQLDIAAKQAVAAMMAELVNDPAALMQAIRDGRS